MTDSPGSLFDFSFDPSPPKPDAPRRPSFPITRRALTPTDVSSYLRLNRCERFLRLKMYQRTHGDKFFHEFDVAPQKISPLLTRTGGEWEAEVNAALREGYGRHFHNYVESQRQEKGQRAPDNARLVQMSRELSPGAVSVVAQPRLNVVLGQWTMRGDADLVRLERSADGKLHVLITDVKSSSAPKVEHRLQVAFYQAMLETLLRDARIRAVDVQTAILYRGPGSETDGDLATQAKRAKDFAYAKTWFGLESGHLEIVEDALPYRAEVDNFVAGRDSVASRVAQAGFDGLFYAITPACDDCLFHQFCLRDAHLTEDLSLVPYLAARDKKALHGVGIRQVRDVATLKSLDPATREITPAPHAGPLLSRLATTSVGPRLSELVLRARANRKVWQNLQLPSLPFLPHKGHTSLPFTSETHNPNLVTIYVDTQFDFVESRMYLLGARVVAHAGGQVAREENVVEITGGPPDTDEKEADLFRRWINRLLSAIVRLAEPDKDGKPSAPIHLVFWNDYGQRQLLDALARNLGVMVSAMPALYDFMTQMAGFDSPVASFLADEIRQHKNYNMLCQNLHRVSSFLKFDWKRYPDGNPTATLRDLFFTGLFDVTGKIEMETDLDADGMPTQEFYTKRARHSSQIPLEYIYCAWHLPQTRVAPGEESGPNDPFAPYRNITPDDVLELQTVRLEAIQHVAGDFKGNDLTTKTAFALPNLAQFNEKAPHLAQALAEFLTIERHATLGAWRQTREAAPEARVLTGETLLVRYVEADQEAGIAEQNRDNGERAALREQFEAEYLATHPHSTGASLSKAQMEQCRWSMSDMPFRLRVETAGVDADLDTALGLTNLKEGDGLVLFPRWTRDSRLPEGEQTDNTPTPKQMLYGCRVRLESIEVTRGADGKATEAWANVSIGRGAGPTTAGYLFSGTNRPLALGGVYTLDPDPNDIYGFWQKKVCDTLVGLEAAKTPHLHPLYRRIAERDLSPIAGWSADADAGQARFFEGLVALHRANVLEHGWEPSKADYIGKHGSDPILLVQGPPGTGKSYSTAFAVLARMQGALAAGLPCRAILCCKTHSATNVLLSGVADALEALEHWRAKSRDLWDEYFDARLLSLPLWRVEGGSGSLPPRVKVVAKDGNRQKGEPKLADEVGAEEHLIFGATPGGVYGWVKERWGNNNLAGHFLCDLLVLDEASQMGLPEALMAALPLGPDGRLIVVGDPRQMPPIVQHDWDGEPRRTFASFRVFESLFNALASLDPPFIRFEESFRLHRAMARFLRDEVYLQDGINYHSRKTKGLAPVRYRDGFVAATLDPEHPLIVIEHSEDQSQKRNVFEEKLIGPVLSALAALDGHNLNARDGLGVVVPHRAQRVGLRQAYPELCILDEDTGEILVEAVDTVEKYQGDEREVILVSATESDPEYLQGSASFLLDPRRLTVALSRAKRKMILVASRSIFEFFSSDEELWGRSQLWKNLLRRTCTMLLWEGDVEGQTVRVWGSGESA